MEALYLKLPGEEAPRGQAASSHRVAGAARGSPLVNETYHGPLIYGEGVARESYHKVLCSVFTKTRTFSNLRFAIASLSNRNKPGVPHPAPALTAPAGPRRPGPPPASPSGPSRRAPPPGPLPPGAGQGSGGTTVDAIARHSDNGGATVDVSDGTRGPAQTGARG